MLKISKEELTHISVLSVLIAGAVGGFFRFYELGSQSLWLDEIATVGPALFASSFYDAYWHHINLHPTPPLYSVFIMGWSALTGYSEAFLRLPSAIIGFSVVGVFYLGLRRVFDKNISATATILMSLSWPAIYYSQEVRAYSAVLLFTTFAAVYWMQIIKATEIKNLKNGPWIRLFIVSVLASFTHPLGFIIVGFQWTYLFFLVYRDKIYVIRVLLFGLTLFFLYLGWFIPNTFGISEILSGNEIYFNRPGLWFFVHIGAFLFHHPMVAFLTCIIPLGIGLVPFMRRFIHYAIKIKMSAPEIYLPFILVIPFLFCFIIAQFKPFLYSRHLIVFLPFIFVFFAYVFSCWHWRHAVFQPIVILLFTLVSCFWIFRDYYIPEKPQNRELAQFALTSLKDNGFIALPCEEEVRFECLLGPR